MIGRITSPYVFENYDGQTLECNLKVEIPIRLQGITFLVDCCCDAPKSDGPYTQIPCYDTPKSGGPADNSSTRRIFMVTFLYIFLTNIQILIIFYKSLVYYSFTLLHAKLY